MTNGGVIGYPSVGATRLLGEVHADTSIASSTTETTLVQFTVPPAAPGDVMTFWADGDMNNSSGSSVNYTWKFYIGGAAVLTSPATGIGTNVNRRLWTCDLRIRAVSGGSRTAGIMRITAGANTTWGSDSFGVTGYGAGTVDLYSGSTCSLSVTMGTAVSTADFFLHGAHLVRVGKA